MLGCDAADWDEDMSEEARLPEGAIEFAVTLSDDRRHARVKLGDVEVPLGREDVRRLVVTLLHMTGVMIEETL